MKVFKSTQAGLFKRWIWTVYYYEYIAFFNIIYFNHLAGKAFIINCYILL